MIVRIGYLAYFVGCGDELFRQCYVFSLKHPHTRSISWCTFDALGNKTKRDYTLLTVLLGFHWYLEVLERQAA